MKITPAFSAAPLTDGGSEAQSSQSGGGVESVFSQYLEAFSASGKTRLQADIAEQAERFDATQWMLRVRHLGLYDKARHDLMAERNLDHGDLEKMSEEESIIFESHVYDRVRDKLVERMGSHRHCHCDEDEIRLYRAAPFLISD